MTLQGNGKLESPYLIYNESDLNEVRNNLSAYYKQMSDVTITSPSFIPLGSFSGYYDGQGYKIINLKINVTSNNTGFFNTLGSGAIVKSINFINPSIKSSQPFTGVGVLAGNALANSEIRYVTVDGGEMIGAGDTSLYWGGLVGDFGVSGIRAYSYDCIVKNISISNVGNSGGIFGRMRTASATRVFGFPTSITGLNTYNFTYTYATTNFVNCGCKGTQSFTARPSGMYNNMEVDDKWKNPSTYSTPNSGLGFLGFNVGSGELIDVPMGEFPKLTLRHTFRNPTLLYTETDIGKLFSNPYHYYQLANDINITLPNLSENGFIGSFYGTLDGRGYFIKGITSPSTLSSSSSTRYFIKELIDGTIKNVGFELNEYSTTSSVINMVSLGKNSIFTNNRIINNNSVFGSTNNNGETRFYYVNGKSYISDNYIQMYLVRGRFFNISYLESSSSGTIFNRNATYVETGSSAQISYLPTSTVINITFLNNMAYSGNIDYVAIPSGVKTFRNFSLFTNPNDAYYSSYTDWVIEQDKHPIQKVFLEKVIQKITKTVKNYNKKFSYRIYKKMTKFKINESFTRQSFTKSKINVKKRIGNFSNNIVMSLKLKYNLIKTIIVNNHTKNIVSGYKLSSLKSLSNYLKNVSLKNVIIKKFNKKIENSVGNIKVKVTSSKRVLNKVMSHTSKISLNLLNIRKILKNPKNTINNFMSKVETITHRYNIVKIEVKNTIKKIFFSSNTIKMKLISLSNYTKKITNKSLVTTPYKVLTDYYARATHTVRKIFTTSYKKGKD